MKNKKITYIHQYFKLPTDNSNSSARSYRVAYKLACEGYKVTVITSGPWDSRFFRKVNLNGKEGNREINIYTIPFPYKQTYSFKLRIIAFILFALGSSFISLLIKSNFLFISSTPITVVLAGLTNKFLIRRNYIFEVRDVWPDVPLGMGIIKNDLFYKRIIYPFSKLAYSNAKGIIALSPGMKKCLEKNYNIKSEIKVCTNFFSLDDFSDFKIRKIKENFKINSIKKRYTILYPGTVGILNNVSYLINLSYYLRKSNFTIKVIGDGNDLKNVIALSNKLGLTDKIVFFKKRLSRELIIKEFIKSDFVISTVAPYKILWDNSANKFFESLASYSVTLINHGGWMKDLLKSNNAGLSLSTNPQKASKQLLKLISNADELNQLRENGRILANNNFTEDKILSSLIDFIKLKTDGL